MHRSSTLQDTALVLATAALVFICGFIAGSGMMLNSWDASAKRGDFEVGHVVYHVISVSP